MPAEHSRKLIVVPGFNASEERVKFFQKATQPWEQQGITSLVVPVPWHEGDHLTHLDMLDDTVSREISGGNKVSLLGASAGGVLAINALAENPEIDKVITVSSRIKPTTIEGYLDLESIRDLSPSSAEGIELLDASKDDSLPPELRSRIMNTRALSGDDQVPPQLSYLEGAYNVWMPPARSHIDAVTTAMTKHSGIIIDFLKQED